MLNKAKNGKIIKFGGMIMFKFIEEKKTFYVCASISIVLTLLSSHLLARNIVSVFGNALTIVLLVAMMAFHSVEHKELMKVLTASLLQMVIMRAVAEYSRIVAPLVDSFNSVKDFFNIYVVTFRGITLIVIFVLLLILFVNHFIINFSGKASKVAIKVNKTVMVVYILFVLGCKIAFATMAYKNFAEFSTMPSKLKMAQILDGIPTMFYALTVVCMEAFVNRERENKNKNILSVIGEKLSSVKKLPKPKKTKKPQKLKKVKKVNKAKK